MPSNKNSSTTSQTQSPTQPVAYRRLLACREVQKRLRRLLVRRFAAGVEFAPMANDPPAETEDITVGQRNARILWQRDHQDRCHSRLQEQQFVLFLEHDLPRMAALTELYVNHSLPRFSHRKVGTSCFNKQISFRWPLTPFCKIPLYTKAAITHFGNAISHLQCLKVRSDFFRCVPGCSCK